MYCVPSSCAELDGWHFKVSPNSPASKAGLQGGDVIQEINGRYSSCSEATAVRLSDVCCSAIVEAGQIYNILGDEVITAESLQS
eukprot:753243-Hanusia_phi.AAC.1